MNNFDENSIESFLNSGIKDIDLFKDEDINSHYDSIENFNPNFERHKEIEIESIIIRNNDISCGDVETKKNKIFNIEKVKEKKNEHILQKKRGRQKANEKSERKHNKNAEDNMITKIKIGIFKYIRDIINQNIPKNITENKEIIKLAHKEIRNLKKDINIEMFGKTLRELFSGIKKSEKFKNKKYKDQNIIIIRDIDEGAIKAEKVKKILDLKFIELLEIFRKKKEEIISENGLEEIYLLVGKNHEKESGSESFINKLKKKNYQDNYIENISNLIFKYEDWFKNKKGRKKSNSESNSM